MTKDKIVADIKFRQQCGKYGLDWDNFEVYDEVILLNTPTKWLYVFMDKNYNVIGVEEWDPLIIQTFPSFIKEKYYEYSTFTGALEYEDGFNYPFEKFTLKNIIDLSNRIEIMETNHGHSLCTRVNGDWYDRNSQENEDNFRLLSYIKFLGEEIKQYFLLNYHMQCMGFEVPNVYSYVRNLISKVNECVDIHLKNNRRPWPSDILSFIGQNYRESKMDGMLYDIAGLLMKEQGFKVKSSSPDKIEKIEHQEENKDLSIEAKNLLKILELSDEDLKRKYEEERQNLIDRYHYSLAPYLEEDIEEDVVKEQKPILSLVKKK